MDYGVSTQMGKPVGGYDPHALMDMDAETRQAAMQRMGVANLLPPLPHSPCLKVIKTGVVHPWNSLLAAQRDLVECCDEHGNTDPAAWKDKVVDHEVDPRVLEMQARQGIIVNRQTAAQQTGGFAHYTPPVTQQNADGRDEYDKMGVVSFNDIERLRKQLRS